MWWIGLIIIAGVVGGVYVITNDKRQMPINAKGVAPLSGPPTSKQISLLERFGFTVDVRENKSGN